MVNTRKKGQRTVLKCRRELTKQEYLTDTTEKTNKYATSKDMFGLFDVIAIKPKQTLLIQCKTNCKPNLQPYQEFINKYPQFEVEIWNWEDFIGFTIYKLYKNKPHKIIA